ncbi:hypothetical protein GF376_01220 [Candidatus Peregrinibacteria bacterium]|nr:hypothetical protein [Candidatus Peregrinibacteria bacterium]
MNQDSARKNGQEISPVKYESGIFKTRAARERQLTEKRMASRNVVSNLQQARARFKLIGGIFGGDKNNE